MSSLLIPGWVDPNNGWLLNVMMVVWCMPCHIQFLFPIGNSCKVNTRKLLTLCDEFVIKVNIRKLLILIPNCGIESMLIPCCGSIIDRMLLRATEVVWGFDKVAPYINHKVKQLIRCCGETRFRDTFPTLIYNRINHLFPTNLASLPSPYFSILASTSDLLFSSPLFTLI